MNVEFFIRSDATVDDLAREVATTTGHPNMTLEVGDGFELRGQEYVMTWWNVPV